MGGWQLCDFRRKKRTVNFFSRLETNSLDASAVLKEKKST
jgi:hypothetical protein